MEKSPYASNVYHEGNENTVWSKLVKMVPKGSTVLDIGCSSGNLGAFLKSKGVAKVVDGLDIDNNDIVLAKKKLNKAIVANIEVDDLSKLGVYDVIIFADVLEHMKDAVKALEVAKQHLAPKGQILFSIPNMAHIAIRLNLLSGDFNYTKTGLIDQTHLHFYTEREVRRIFSSANLDIEAFNNTVLDLPDELIKEKLSVVKLDTTKEFLELSHSLPSITFEFIGRARVSKHATKIELDTTSPLDEVIGFVQRAKDAAESDARQLTQKIAADEEHIKKIERAYRQVVEDNKKLQIDLERSSLLKRIKKHIR